MDTSSLIGYETESGAVRYTTCECHGHLEQTGRILGSFYQGEVPAHKLVDGGSMVSLSPALRLRGPSGGATREARDRDDFMDLALISDADFAYVFGRDGNWSFTCCAPWRGDVDEELGWRQLPKHDIYPVGTSEFEQKCEEYIRAVRETRWKGEEISFERLELPGAYYADVYLRDEDRRGTVSVINNLFGGKPLVRDEIEPSLKPCFDRHPGLESVDVVPVYVGFSDDGKSWHHVMGRMVGIKRQEVMDRAEKKNMDAASIETAAQRYVDGIEDEAEQGSAKKL
jgi:hypothetical protein